MKNCIKSDSSDEDKKDQIEHTHLNMFGKNEFYKYG